MIRYVLPVISAVLLILAYPPFGQGLLAWVAFVPLFFSLHGKTGRDAFKAGFVYGFVFFLGTVYWVVHSMFFYGGVGLGASVPVMLLLVVYLALYPALFGLFASRVVMASALARFFLLPAAWVALEFIRGHLFTGFPWVLTGYTQATATAVIQVADTTGVWGVSYLVLSVNTAIFLFARSALDRSGALPYKVAVLALVLLTSALAYGFISLSATDKAASTWAPVRTAVIQGSIDQSMKWDESFRDKTVEIYRDLTVEQARSRPDLVIWPETAVPFFLGSEREDTEKVADVARAAGAYLLTGSPSFKVAGTGSGPSGRKVEYFNSAYLLGPDGEISGRYDKIHLVPFGEYVPLKRLLFFVKKLTAGVGDFSEGPGPVPIAFGNSGIGVLICYESIFPEIASGSVAAGAGLLVNITNDGWFGRTSAPYQHFEMSILRAVENRTYLVRAANTGISAVIDPAGRVRRKTALFIRTGFGETVRLRPGPGTFYTRYGDVFAYGCLAYAFLYLLAGYFTRR